ncbi:MAG: cobalamin-independent methionine synthase II family protein [Pseudomonadota bacterium]|nr:cobalamin-independent methionine synthase II family protein [Pseudomonadota bacterium]
MYKGSDGIILPTSIIGSLPRPAWFTDNLYRRSFLEAMVDNRYREQYEDAVMVYLKAQELAGVDICTDGDAHFDTQVAGLSWQSYAPFRMEGFAANNPQPSEYKVGAAAYPRGHILHDFLEVRVLPAIVGPVGPGDLQFAALWRAAQRLTEKPIKFGTITPELLAASVEDEYYKDPVERTMALSQALNIELNDLADAGCPVIQMEEPQIHMTPVRGDLFGKLGVNELVDVFNQTVAGLREKTEVWCHTCWGNPSQQRIFKEVQNYQPTLEALNQVDADVLTFETCSSGIGDLQAIGEVIEQKKVAIGVIDHHTLQVEHPDQVANLIRQALKHIPAERLIISSDCGMGREGMSRRHATYKMVAMVQGTNMIRKELGLPEARCLAEAQEFSLAASTET